MNFRTLCVFPSLSGLLNQRVCRLLILASALVAAFSHEPLMASRSYRVSPAVTSHIGLGVDHGESMRLDSFPLINGDPATLELERFEVWDSESQFVVHEADGKSMKVFPRPLTRFFKGRVVGESDSAVAISVEPDGQINGTIFVRERVFSLGTATRLSGATAREPHSEDPSPSRERTERTDLFVREIDPVEDLVVNPAARDWHCDISFNVSTMAPGPLPTYTPRIRRLTV